jgi:cytidylate kinase
MPLMGPLLSLPQTCSNGRLHRGHQPPWVVTRNHAKDVIRLKAEMATMRLDVQPLLEADPVDLAKAKQQFLTIAAKEVDLHMAHVTAMQDIRKVLTPEQQQQFKTMQGRMMREGGRREHHERD